MKKLDGYNHELKETPLEDKIEFVKALEKEALELDSRIAAVSYCIYKEIESGKYLYNTKGLDLNNNVNLAVAYIMAIAKEGEETKTGLSYRIVKNFSRPRL